MDVALVTGGTGFVGSWLVRELLDRGYRVVILHRRERPLSPFRLLMETEFFCPESDMVLVRGDVCDADFVYSILVQHGVTHVFHLAAQPDVRIAMRDPIGTWRTNVMGTLSVLEACRRYGDVQAVVTMSTDKVYGARIDAREDSPLNPVEIYGASKMAADVLARVYARVYDMPVTVARPVNMVGPGDTGRRIVPNVIRACLRGESPVIYRGVRCAREYVYVGDVVSAIALLAERIDRTRGEAYNIGGATVRTQEEVVLEVLKWFEGIEPRYVDPPPHVRKEIPAQSVRDAKIEALGWRPETTFPAMVWVTVQWWRKIARRHPELLEV